MSTSPPSSTSGGLAMIRGGTRFHHEAGQPEPLDEISGLF